MSTCSRSAVRALLLILLLAPMPATLPVSAFGQEGSKPVVALRFDTEEVIRLVPHGGLHRDQAGPRPPEFPDFAPNNTAVMLDGRGARFSIKDPGPASPFDFDNGDAITIEAWVNMEEPIAHNQNVYIIGKGRTNDPQFPGDNQNWALRLRGVDGQARLNFLFATPKVAGSANRDAHWHRWTSHTGFVPGTGWHHIAISYRFGEPTSIQGWLNAQRIDGKWDMGGPTDQAPVVDDDAVWIGSSLGGSSGNSFNGLLDEITIFRDQLSDEQMAKRYRREGPERPIDRLPEVVPRLATTPTAITVRIFDGLAAHNNWTPEHKLPAEPVIEYEVDDFLLTRLPRRYDDWGIRASWQSTSLLQAATDVELPAGEHRLLLRSRGLSRLWLNDEVVARTAIPNTATDGHQPVDPLPEPPAPGNRLCGYGDQEVLVPLKLATGGVYRVILESLVGGTRFRAEPGETLVAIQLQGSNSFELLRPHAAGSPSVLLIDGEIEAALDRMEQRLDALDKRIRGRQAASQDDYWAARHDAARTWVEQQPASEVPVVSGFSGTHPIDAFLAEKIEQARSQATDGAHGDAEFFRGHVLPILQDNCFRCHSDQAEGGLQLTSRDGVLAGGDSGEPAATPHAPNESQLLARVRSQDEGERMPPSSNLTEAQVATLEQWIQSGVAWGRAFAPEAIEPVSIVDDASFLRRAYLDCWGIPPTETELRSFLADQDPHKRAKAIDRLLADERVADHWVSYWQDVLAENPSILKPSLNNTGPFRYFLHEAIRDNRPFDRLVTELVMLRGSEREGGSAGFGMAADNDAPLATRSLVLASAFLGIDMQCARCHDSPYHSTTQQDLFALSAMLARSSVTVPPTSTVAPGFFEQHKGRESLIRVTLKPGVKVEPQWPFASATGAEDNDWLRDLMQQPDDSRERLAALITAPSNERFAAVIVNRIWKRLLGAGLVEPVDDWEAARASHPQLLTWLSREFVASGYDMRYLMRLVMTSDLYQRQAVGSNAEAIAEVRFFTAPERRRLTAEQVVDSLFHASGHRMQVEQLTFDSDGRRPADTMISLGYPRRAWEFAELSNERDRPSLALPRAQAVIDVLEAFGWTGSRQNAVTDRDDDPNVLQPGILSNGVMASWITRASLSSELASMAIAADAPESLVDALFLRFLSRYPTADERELYGETLAEGFERRLLPSEVVVWPEKPPTLSHVSWSNHLRSEANSIKIEMEQRARRGDPPDPRLRADWREAYEDVVWALVNSPEFVWIP